MLLPDRDHWKGVNEKELAKALKNTPNTNVAKNLVLAIGDGMGPTTTTGKRNHCCKRAAVHAVLACVLYRLIFIFFLTYAVCHFFLS